KTGALIGGLICGILAGNINWHLGFSPAGVGMVLGVIQYALGSKHLGLAGELKGEAQTPATRQQASRSLLRGVEAMVGLFLVFTALESIGVIHVTLLGFVDSMGVFIAGLAAAYLLWLVVFGRLTVV